MSNGENGDAAEREQLAAFFRQALSELQANPEAGIGGVAGFLGKQIGNVWANAIGFGAGTALGSAMEPLAQGERNILWPLSPNVPLSPEILAAMVVQGIITEDDGKREAKKSGIAEGRFHNLFLVNGDPIAPEQALDLWNRGEITKDDVEKALRQSRLKPEWVEQFKLLRFQRLAAADLAEMVIQNIIHEDDGVLAAHEVGVREVDFRKMVLLAGNPPGPQETLEMWNRNLISKEDADKALRQSRLKPEWVEQFKLLRERPATLGAIVTARVKEEIDDKEALRLAAEIGISPATFELALAGAGRPIAIGQALTLYNRKEFHKSDVQRVVAHSDVRTEYIDDILKLAVRYPSLFQIGRLVSSGAIDDAYAIQLITEQGYPETLAKGIVQASHSSKVQKHKDLTTSEIEALFQGEGISRADAVGMLKALSYDDTEAHFILDLAEFRRIARFIEAVINRVHSQYVNHRIGVDAVTTALDKAGVPSDQREQLINLWDEERGANVRTLTPAQVHSAFKKGKLDLPAATAKMIQLGYSAEDAGILLSL